MTRQHMSVAVRAKRLRWETQEKGDGTDKMRLCDFGGRLVGIEKDIHTYCMYRGKAGKAGKAGEAGKAVPVRKVQTLQHFSKRSKAFIELSHRPSRPTSKKREPWTPSKSCRSLCCQLVVDPTLSTTYIQCYHYSSILHCLWPLAPSIDYRGANN